MSKINNIKEGVKISVGCDDFRTLVLHNDIFVDKSLLLKEVAADDGTAFLITRPRRWGKSLNLSMIGRFLEIEVDREGNPLPEEERINDKLFRGGEVVLEGGELKKLKSLKIASDATLMKKQGKFPVMRLSLKEINGDSVGRIAEQLKLKIQSLFREYEYLENSDKISVAEKVDFQAYVRGNFTSEKSETSLKFLSRLLFKHFGKKVCILVDEYDAPINSAYLDFGLGSESYKAVIKIFRNFFGSAFKTNEYLAKGVITGILRIAKANLLSDLNNLTENSLFDEELTQCYGFTEKEVETLLELVPVEVDPKEIKDWYNGYSFGGQIIYNPWSIMQCLRKSGKLDHYWLDSGGTNIIDHVLRSDAVQQDLQNLVAGKSIISEVTKYINFDEIQTRSGLFSLLLLSGYLSPKPVEESRDIYELSVPNTEVLYIYEKRLLQWLNISLPTADTTYYFFAKNLEQGKLEEFSAELSNILELASFHQTGPKKAELFYSGFMLAILSFLRINYIIENEVETGKGRADVLLISKAHKGGSNAIIVEYKICKTEEDLAKAAQAGLKQIAERNYAARIKRYDHVKQIIKISISFCGKAAETAYEIDYPG